MALTITYNLEQIELLDVAGTDTVSDASRLSNLGLAFAGAGGAGTDMTLFDRAGAVAADLAGWTGTGATVAGLKNGNVLLAYEVGNAIEFHLRTNSGEALGGPGEIGSFLIDKTALDAAGLDNNGFVIAYHEQFKGADHDVSVSVHAENGTKITTVPVTAGVENDQAPSVAGLNDGGFAVTWHRIVGDATEIWYAVYENDGTVRKAPTRLDGFGDHNQNPTVIAIQTGGFAIAYEDRLVANGDIEIMLGRFDEEGSLIDLESATDNNVDDRAPTLDRLTNGMYVIGSTTSGDPRWTLVSHDGEQLATSTLGATVNAEGAATVVGLALGRFGAFFEDQHAGEAKGLIIGATRTTQGDAAGDVITCDDLTDIVFAGLGADTIAGGGSADELHGQGGADIFTFYAGDVAPAELIDGGEGFDALHVGIEEVNFGPGKLVSIEKIRLEGVHGPSVYDSVAFVKASQIGAGLASDLVVEAASAAPETLRVALGTGTSVDLSGFSFLGFDTTEDRVVVVGSGGDDKIIGSSTVDLILGKAGADDLRGGEESDILRGGAGDDFYLVDEIGEAREAFGQGTDTVRSTVDYVLAPNIERLQLLGAGDLSGFGNSLHNQLFGGGGANLLLGRGGNDLLSGGGGVDQLRGGFGDDIYVIDHSSEAREAAGAGVDTVRSGIGYVLTPHVEVLQLTGSAHINGRGNGLANVIVGNSGDNVLNGVWGNDELEGGAGADTFLFNTALAGVLNADTIVDFTAGEDLIKLDDAIFAGLTNAGRPAAFHVGLAAADASDRLIYDPTTGALYFDSDGTGAAAQTLFAKLQPGLALDAGDFWIV